LANLAASVRDFIVSALAIAVIRPAAWLQPLERASARSRAAVCVVAISIPGLGMQPSESVFEVKGITAAVR
jgi:hypothetical protein